MSRWLAGRTVVEGDGGHARRWLVGTFLAAVVAIVPLAGSPGVARAQDASGSPSAGITVIGYGEASAPAEKADLQILVSEVNFEMVPLAPRMVCIKG